MEYCEGPNGRTAEEQRTQLLVRISWRERRYFLAKRIMDVALSSLCLVALLPLMTLVALAIRSGSRGPVIFRQERVGYDTKKRVLKNFVMYKFRTMHHKCDQDVHRKYVTAAITGGPSVEALRDRNGILKITDDPRVTRVGRHLRRSAVDELPQLFNVLKGDMSLVGPRPALPYELDAYKPHHWARLNAKPGCTGLWQVSGWCKLDFDEMVRLDLEYIARQSLWLDLQILMRTVPVVLARRGGG